MTTVVVSGALANKVWSGGEAWVRLSWALGLRRLGLVVYFVEQLADAACVDESGAPAPFEASANLSYFEAVVERFGLRGQAALVREGGTLTSGLSLDDLAAVAESADLLVNISGHLTLEPILRRFRRKAYVDLDPGFTQFWHAAGDPGARLAGHDVFFSVGANVGRRRCRIPAGGIHWRAVRPPILLDEWPVAAPTGLGRFTTVATWRNPYGRIEFAGESFGLKVHEFRKVLSLPGRLPQAFEIALDIDPGDRADHDALRAHGWRLVDPRPAAGDPEAYRRYVTASDAEFSVAQGVYVETASGWFSDRTAAYLAAGRPALVQDTGLEGELPVGEGLVVFQTLDGAVDGARRIAADYAGHAAAARAIAEEFLDSDRVLARFLDEAGVES